MPVIPIEIQKMVELPKNQLDFETLQDYYKISIFFVNQEINLFRLFFFALTIKV